MSTQQKSKMTWPSHGPRGRHDWWTYLERGYVDPFRDVVREMPDVDVHGDSGRTMLMEVLAYVGGKPWLEIVTLLIKAGADVNRRDSSGRPVWDFAPTSGPSCDEIGRTLIHAGLDVNTRGVKNETPLIRVCAVYSADHPIVLSALRSIVQLLLDAGAEVNVVDQYNVSPLRAAAGTGNIEVVKVLLKAGANPNMVGSGTRSTLLMPQFTDMPALCRRCSRLCGGCHAWQPGAIFPRIHAGYVDVEGVTPLIAAAEGGHFQVVRLLVDAGADVNRSDSSGFTPLMGAARAGHPKMVQFLVERGARLDAVDASGWNAQKHATEFKHLREIAPILQRAE